MSLKKIKLPERYNYIACFLTLECNFKCDYCINYYGSGNGFNKQVVSGKKWVEMLNRLICRPDLPVTLQGGEPGLHPDFIGIIKNLEASISIDILTNLSFDIGKFINNINPHRLRRNAPYPNIRVSYHPYHTDLDELINKVLKLQHVGFSVGIFSILHPELKQIVLEAEKKCRNLGIDFRTKEFLGEYKGKLFGTYLYPEAISNSNQKECLCRTSEFIIGPDGNVYRCHRDLYKNFPPIGNLTDQSFEIEDMYRKCNHFGDCNPCDIKIKTNRFQVYGHTSVEIRDLKNDI
jgi:hypothetical protein